MSSWAFSSSLFCVLYPVLPVSLDCSFCVVSSVFSQPLLFTTAVYDTALRLLSACRVCLVLFQRQMCNIAAIVFVHKAYTQNLIWLHWDGIIGECCVTRGQITHNSNGAQYACFQWATTERS